MIRFLIPALAGSLLAGCGYVAGPLPPLANVPARVNDLAAVERGTRLIIHLTVPTLTTEGITMPMPPRVELRIGPAPAAFNADQWAASAKDIPPVTPDNGVAEYAVPAAEWVGKDVTIGARVIGANGKNAGWSFVNLPIVAAPAQPTGLQPAVTPAGLRLTWQARGDHFRVLRSTGSNERYDVVATVTENQWTDPNITYGTAYRYRVQTFVPLGDNREAQSELSEPLPVTPEAPPPAAPTGLHVVPGPNSIELSWDGNAEPDVVGYRVYRGAPGGPLAPIGEAGSIPSYSDRTAEHAHNFRYAVTALTRSGHESAQSATADVAFP